jgi:hypothetical protein
MAASPPVQNSIKDLAEAAYGADELEFLLKNSAFRLLHDAPESSPEDLERLCLVGSALLSARTGLSHRHQWKSAVFAK